jgi:hypothetical protein
MRQFMSRGIRKSLPGYCIRNLNPDSTCYLYDDDDDRKFEHKIYIYKMIINILKRKYAASTGLSQLLTL